MVGLIAAHGVSSEACLVQSSKVSRGAKDGAFVREAPYFTRRFGYGIGDIPVLPNRYVVLGYPTCGWNHRQRMVLRLLGLDRVVSFEDMPTRDEVGGVLDPNGLTAGFGYRHLNDFYDATDPDWKGRATSPTVIDLETGRVVSNNYHTLTLDWETVWRPYWKADAPDLYPQELRRDIDVLNQQLFDDVNNGTYKISFAGNRRVGEVAYAVFQARLTDLDYRLESRRFLFGSRLTDSDVRLFQTLVSWETKYRPSAIRVLGHDDLLHLWEFPNLWGYARDLFQTDGFMDDHEKFEFGYIPDSNGEYSSDMDRRTRGSNPGNVANTFGGAPTEHRREFLERWLERPTERYGLDNEQPYSGPGTAGLPGLWRFA